MKKGENSYLRFIDGDDEGFVDLIREYKDGLLLFIDKFINDIHISEEAADDVFMKLYISKPKYKSEYSFKTWLYAMGKNTAVDYMRKIKKGKYVPLEDYYYMSDETNIENDYIIEEEKRILYQAINNLKKEYSQVLHLVYIEGLSNTEVSEIMDKTPRQISDLIYRAKNSLKSELERSEKDGQI